MKKNIAAILVLLGSLFLNWSLYFYQEPFKFYIKSLNNEIEKQTREYIKCREKLESLRN